MCKTMLLCLYKHNHKARPRKKRARWFQSKRSIYTEGEEFDEDEYFSAEAKTKEEAKQLIEAGYSYVTDVDGVKLFKKPK